MCFFLCVFVGQQNRAEKKMIIHPFPFQHQKVCEIYIPFEGAAETRKRSQQAKSSKSLYVTNTQSERIRRTTVGGFDLGTTAERVAAVAAARGPKNGKSGMWKKSSELFVKVNMFGMLVKFYICLWQRTI